MEDILKGMSRVSTYPNVEFWGTMLNVKDSDDVPCFETFGLDYVKSRLNYGVCIVSAPEQRSYVISGIEFNGIAVEVETMHKKLFAVFSFRLGNLDFVAIIALPPE